MGGEPEADVTRVPGGNDLVSLARELNRLGVAYVVVGGFAVNRLGLVRATDDLDLLIARDKANQALVRFPQPQEFGQKAPASSAPDRTVPRRAPTTALQKQDLRRCHNGACPTCATSNRPRLLTSRRPGQPMHTAMTWEQICDDPHLRDLPYKIEQDRFGRIVMSPPANTDHGEYQARIAWVLATELPDYVVLTECGVDTDEGVKVPDVAAMTRVRRRLHQGRPSFPEAPEICIEVLSVRNTTEEMDEKRRLYAARGCREFWTCSEQGRMTFLDANTGQNLTQSGLCPGFPVAIRLD